MKTLTFKQVTPYIVALVLIIVASLFMNDCKGKQLTGSIPTEPSKTEVALNGIVNAKQQKDEMQQRIIIKLTIQLDSFKLHQPKYLKSKNKRDSIIYKEAPFNCQPYMDSLKSNSNIYIDSLNSNSQTKDNTILALKNDLSIKNDLMDLEKLKYSMQSDTLKEVKIELKQSEKHNKNSKIISTLEKIGLSILSFFSGVGIGTLKP